MPLQSLQLTPSSSSTDTLNHTNNNQHNTNGINNHFPSTNKSKPVRPSSTHDAEFKSKRKSTFRQRKRIRLSDSSSDDGSVSDDSATSGNFLVDYIVKHRSKSGRREYLVHWAGYGVEDRTWYVYSHIGSVYV